MTDLQIAQLLHDVAIGRNCLIIVAACTVLVAAYTLFSFWKWGLADSCSADARLRKRLWRAQSRGDYAQVVTLCRRKLASAPGDSWCLFTMGIAQLNLKLWQEAIDTMQELLLKAPQMKPQADAVIDRARAGLGSGGTA